MEISFCYRRIFFTKGFTVKFRAWHDFGTVVVCVQFCNDMVPKDGVTRKPNICPPICINMENRWRNRPLAQHWFGKWLVSCLAQAITRTTVDSTVVGILAFTWVMGGWPTMFIIQQICFGLHRSWVFIFQWNIVLIMPENLSFIFVIGYRENKPKSRLEMQRLIHKQVHNLSPVFW